MNETFNERYIDLHIGRKHKENFSCSGKVVEKGKEYDCAFVTTVAQDATKCLVNRLNLKTTCLPVRIKSVHLYVKNAGKIFVNERN